MDLRQINQFLAVAETLSFRKAAERLHMAQPPLSMAIRRIEVAIGAPLFKRGRRGVTLTEVGAAILADARRVAFQAEQLRRATATAVAGDSGVLRVAFVGSATYTLLPRSLPPFREQYPQLSLELKEGTTTQALRDLEAGTLDLGLVRYPVFEPCTAALEVVEEDVLMIVLRAGSPLARRRRLSLNDLAHEPFVMYAAAAAANLRGQVMMLCQAAGFTPHVVQEAVQVQTIVSLVESGLGIALVPSRASCHAPAGVVFRHVTPESPLLSVAIALASRPEMRTQAAARFRELLLDQARTAAAQRPR
ncbi:MAG: LysR family transcriptional regulator [Burkholderiales bacterium]|nr:LysR family transcriptional regulator [Burkholderiales bacterium]